MSLLALFEMRAILQGDDSKNPTEIWVFAIIS